MQNGQANGAGATPGPIVQVHPQQAAAFALQFLPRAPHTQGEREAFDLATMFLQAIVNGQVLVTPAPQVQTLQPAAAADPPPA